LIHDRPDAGVGGDMSFVPGDGCEFDQVLPGRSDAENAHAPGGLLQLFGNFVAEDPSISAFETARVSQSAFPSWM